jgi:hypothetical protein
VLPFLKNQERSKEIPRERQDIGLGALATILAAEKSTAVTWVAARKQNLASKYADDDPNYIGLGVAGYL